MRLTFKRRFGFGFTERDVPITLNLGTLDAVCKALNIIGFRQISDIVKKNNFDFTVELLYQGYLTACKEKFRKPKYDREKAVLWYEHMSHSSQKEFMEMMAILFDDITKTAEFKTGIKHLRQRKNKPAIQEKPE